MRRSRLAGFVVLSLLAAACGSTVGASRSGLAANSGAGTNGLGGPPAGTSSSGPGGSVTGAVGGVGGTGPSSTAPGATSLSGSGGGTAAPGTTTASVGPGVSATTINIGLTVTDNSKAAASALGASGQGVGGGDAEAQYNIIINDINAHGGVLGHKLKALIYHYDATSTASLDQQESAACAYWTQDHKVLAVAAGDGTQGNTLLSCLNKAGVIQVYEEFTSSDLSTFRQFPYYFEIGTLDADRMTAAWPAQLKAQGYFGGWDYNTGTASKVTPVKIGIISFDDAVSTRAVTSYLEPALKAMGYGWVPLADVNYADNPTNGPDSNASRQHCVKLMRDHGQTVSDAITERQVVEACDELYFLADNMRLAGALNRNAFLTAVNSLGAGFVAGDTFSTFFAASRHDGVATGRPFAYVASCTCFRYNGPRFQIS